MVRLSFDQEAWDRGIRSMPLPPDVHEEIECVLRARLLRLVAEGTDVILDFSFWSRRARESYRALLRPLGVEPETIYVATPRDVVLERIRARSGAHGDDFALTEAIATEYFDHFEPPTEDEGALTVVEASPPPRSP